MPKIIRVNNDDLGVYKHFPKMEKSRFTAFKSWVYEKYSKKYKNPVFCKAVKEDIHITKSGLKHALNSRGSILKTKSITVLDELINKALLVDIKNDKNDKNKKVGILVSLVSIDDVLYKARMIIKENPVNRLMYYHHDLTTFKKAS